MIFKQRNDNTWEGEGKLKGESESGPIKTLVGIFSTKKEILLLAGIARKVGAFSCALFRNAERCCKIISS